MAIDAGTTDIKALRVGSTVISRAFLGNQKIYDQLDYPTLDLNFALTKTLDPRVTFTRASTATYFDSAGVLRSAAINEPRFDYNPATLVAQGLLIEEQRTNLLLQSADFTTVWGQLNVTITANTTASPDGGTNGDTLVVNSVAAATSQLSQAFPVGSTITISVFAKKNTSNFLRMEINNIVNCWWNLDTGATASNNTGGGNVVFSSKSIQAISNGWYRCVLTLTTSAVTKLSTSIYATNSDGNTSSVNSSIFLWGAQLEVGAFATSYIPTTTTALTRAADIAVMTGTNFSSWYNQSEGTVSVAFDVYAPSVPDGYGRVYQIDDGTLNNNIALLKNNGFGSVYYGYVGVAGVVQVTLFTPAILANIPVKVATAYKLNDFAQSTNGESVTTDTSGTIPTVTQMRIGSTSGSAAMNGHIRRITYFNRRLANSELQLLSS